ncbi:MAG: hypothetical protein DI585_04035 [Pseudomonas fluorescens]|nr:MAG: hypothetical protein DI585_04035 [Pseudomonas fluorescens]
MRIPFTLKKTTTYALMHMSVAITVAYILSGSWKTALAIGMIEPVVQTVCYFFHERAWHRIERRKHVKDHHDSIIDSTTPATHWLEKLLSHRHKH